MEGKIVIVAGPPASGKGTQCEMMVADYGFVHISTGDLLRAKQNYMPELKEFMNNGLLVPDRIVIGLLSQRLQEQDVKKHGAIIDGFPRTLIQAKALAEGGVVVDKFIFIDVPDNVVVERISGRRNDPVTGKVYHIKYRPAPVDVQSRLVVRGDDTEEKVRVRLSNFHSHMKQLLDYYQPAVSRLQCGAAPPKIVYQAVTQVLEDKPIKVHPAHRSNL